MSSSRWLRPSTASQTPQLVYETVHRFRRIQVHVTSCIVTRFGLSSTTGCSVLVNPSNPELSGCRNFPYFPRGGPVPNRVDSMHKDWQPLGFVSQWGGMEVGTGMLFPVSVIDGLVHQLGGWSLQAELALHRLRSPTPCQVGTCVRTTAGYQSELYKEYHSIVHTTPPFYKYDTEPERKLRQCYKVSLAAALEETAAGEDRRVAVPLLGAGARGFPKHVAIRVASESVVQWLGLQGTPSDGGRESDGGRQTIAFGLLEEEDAQELSEAIDRQLTV